MLAPRTIPLLALGLSSLGLISASLEERQRLTTSYRAASPTEVIPNGVAPLPGQFEAGFPLVCLEGCYSVLTAYSACFIFAGVPNTNPPVTTNQTECDDYFCNEVRYEHLSLCLNCMVANGGERPLGYHSNSALTENPTAIGGIPVPTSPLGLLDEEQGNGWLRNVTQRCASISTTLTGASTITASPTTTGPYYTTYTRGATVSLPKWTGVADYSITVPVLTALDVPITTGTPEGAGRARMKLPGAWLLSGGLLALFLS